ncbi:two-component sensor histidine kinase [Cereibacter sphaeroides]|uniref:sensor histidine kinase n=1 Tax=Rhodobacterales TaxID=204455 RepID=UPI000BBE2E6A|nr:MULTISPECIES: ATP-binding protein [Paracoccaceae]MCE6952853.1 two-component sensor histidine kinase [Cereibacter sphaeroides]MCE6962049.1 two-component sensor histidine kinase [Cereibacter sphaeroides]MCE6970824.1 two-component sensor histidine kinase [Cereibacter sphaeroides]MCE6975580.1 two-component sensor histidine kinase [Cereibacter sphaeroides]
MDAQAIGSLMEGIPLPIVLIGADERIRAANPPALRLFGQGIVARHFVMAMRQPALLDAVEGALRLSRPGRARHIITGPSREVTYRVTVTPVDWDGNRFALCAFEDITEQEQMGAIRRDFVANVSHELRTPLTALLGFIETLQGAARDDPAARERFLTIMAREAGRMNRLVQDLLSLSRVEAEERVRPTSSIDVGAVIGQAIAALKPMAEAAGVEILRTGETGTLVLPGDPDQLTQVFHNLIENAVKYGGAGKAVTVHVALDSEGLARLGPAVRIEVIDRGEGIDAIHLPRLTERFYRVDTHRSREKGGTGLGLAIVKHIVNRHRGRFRIESERGKGSRFIVTLPAG